MTDTEVAKLAAIKAKLIALTALEACPGWVVFTKELQTRLAKCTKHACDLSRRGRERTGAAGAANELEELAKYVTNTIATLTAALEEGKNKARSQKPDPSS